jgi:chromosome segregation ATPase
MEKLNIEILNSNIEHLRSDIDEMRSESSKWRESIARLLERLADYSETKESFDTRIRTLERFQWKFAGFVLALVIIFELMLV